MERERERERVQPHGRDVGSTGRVQTHTLGCDLKETAKLHYKNLSRERHPNLAPPVSQKKKKKLSSP